MPDENMMYLGTFYNILIKSSDTANEKEEEIPVAEIMMPMHLPDQLVKLYQNRLVKCLSCTNEIGEFYHADGITVDHCAGLIVTVDQMVFPFFYKDLTTFKPLEIQEKQFDIDPRQLPKEKILMQRATTFNNITLDMREGTIEESIMSYNKARSDRFLITMLAVFCGPKDAYKQEKE